MEKCHEYRACHDAREVYKEMMRRIRGRIRGELNYEKSERIVAITLRLNVYDNMAEGRNNSWMGMCY